MVSRSALPGPSGSGSVKCAPAYATLSRRSAIRTISTYSRVRASGAAKRTPCQPSLTCGPDTPSPRWNRPPLKRVERGGGHRRHRRGARRDLHDPGTQPDRRGLPGEPGEHGRGVGPVGLGHPRLGVPEALRLPHEVEGVRSQSHARVTAGDRQPHGAHGSEGPGDRVAAMLTRRLGTSGLAVSRLGLGTMAWGTRTSPEDARDLLDGLPLRRRHARRHRARVRRGRRGGPARRPARGPDRDEVVLVTKSGISRATGNRVVDCSRRALMHQLDTSLRRLRTDHVDVWLAHTWDEHTPIEETVSALVWAVETGRARYVGRLQPRRLAGGAHDVAARGIRGAAGRELGRVQPGRPHARARARRRRGSPRLRAAAVVPARARGAGRALPHHRRGRLAAGLGGVRRGSPGGTSATTPAGWSRRCTPRRTGLGVAPAVVALAWVRDRPGRHRADHRPAHADPARRRCSTPRTSSCPSRSCTRSTRCRSTTPELAGRVSGAAGRPRSSVSSSNSMSSSRPGVEPRAVAVLVVVVVELVAVAVVVGSSSSSSSSSVVVVVVVAAVDVEGRHLAVGVVERPVVRLEGVGEVLVGGDDRGVVVTVPGAARLQVALEGGDELAQCGTRIGAHGADATGPWAQCVDGRVRVPRPLLRQGGRARRHPAPAHGARRVRPLGAGAHASPTSAAARGPGCGAASSGRAGR